MLNEFGEDIKASQSEAYVIAIGTNDIRYLNVKTCSMTSESYVQVMDKMVNTIKADNPKAKIAIIAPWMTLDNDRESSRSHEEKNKMTDEYSAALQDYCAENSFCFVDANPYLREFFENNARKLYTKDGIHPNAERGLELYSKAVLESSK